MRNTTGIFRDRKFAKSQFNMIYIPLIDEQMDHTER